MRHAAPHDQRSPAKGWRIIGLAAIGLLVLTRSADLLKAQSNESSPDSKSWRFPRPGLPAAGGELLAPNLEQWVERNGIAMESPPLLARLRGR